MPRARLWPYTDAVTTRSSRHALVSIVSSLALLAWGLPMLFGYHHSTPVAIGLLATSAVFLVLQVTYWLRLHGEHRNTTTKLV